MFWAKIDNRSKKLFQLLPHLNWTNRRSKNCWCIFQNPNHLTGPNFNLNQNHSSFIPANIWYPSKCSLFLYLWESDPPSIFQHTVKNLRLTKVQKKRYFQHLKIALVCVRESFTLIMCVYSYNKSIKLRDPPCSRLSGSCIIYPPHIFFRKIKNYTGADMKKKIFAFMKIIVPLYWLFSASKICTLLPQNLHQKIHSYVYLPLFFNCTW